MQLIKQSFEILEQKIPVRKLDDYSGSHFREEYMKNMYKHIEKCGKICYRAEHNITKDSYKRFVQRMIDSQHWSTLEHGIIYLRLPYNDDCNKYSKILEKYDKNPYSKISTSEYAYLTTNYRTIIENGWEDDLQYLCEPTKYHEKRHTVLLHSCIHCYKDLTRHRKMSFSIESTRYCNYSKTHKFGEMKFVLPPWCKYISPGKVY